MKIDKFKETALTKKPAVKVRAPIIDECIAHMECKVTKKIITGDKNLFIGEVIEAKADEDIVKDKRKIEYAKGDFPRKVYATRFKKC